MIHNRLVSFEALVPGHRPGLSILGLMAVLGSVGCGSLEKYSIPDFSRMERRSPLQAEMTSSPNGSHLPVERSDNQSVTIKPDPSDPGAVDLVNSLLTDLPAPRRGPDDWTVIDCSNLLNQSRSSRDEYLTFRKRLTGLLSQAGREHRLRFTVNGETSIQYELKGTIYLITSGLDQWDLFLSLTEHRQNQVIWEPAGAVRILRKPDSHRPQIQVLH